MNFLNENASPEILDQYNDIIIGGSWVAFTQELPWWHMPDSGKDFTGFTYGVVDQNKQVMIEWDVCAIKVTYYLVDNETLFMALVDEQKFEEATRIVWDETVSDNTMLGMLAIFLVKKGFLVNIKKTEVDS